MAFILNPEDSSGYFKHNLLNVRNPIIYSRLNF